ncbi:hypothetical protein SCA6_014934 [Theobroma cacao]
MSRTHISVPCVEVNFFTVQPGRGSCVYKDFCGESKPTLLVVLSILWTFLEHPVQTDSLLLHSSSTILEKNLFIMVVERTSIAKLLILSTTIRGRESGSSLSILCRLTVILYCQINKEPQQWITQSGKSPIDNQLVEQGNLVFVNLPGNCSSCTLRSFVETGISASFMRTISK